MKSVYSIICAIMKIGGRNIRIFYFCYGAEKVIQNIVFILIIYYVLTRVQFLQWRDVWGMVTVPH